jgi:hypothetical protein
VALNTKDQSNQSNLRWANYILFISMEGLVWARQDETDICFKSFYAGMTVPFY